MIALIVTLTGLSKYAIKAFRSQISCITAQEVAVDWVHLIILAHTPASLHSGADR